MIFVFRELILLHVTRNTKHTTKMYYIGDIVKANNKDIRDEENRKIANYESQPNGEVWTRFEGRLKIIAAGEAAKAFLAKVKGFNPGQLRVELKARYA